MIDCQLCRCDSIVFLTIEPGINKVHHMITLKKWLSLFFTTASVLADPFINLDFEQVAASPPSNDIKDLLLGWSLSYNSQSIYNIGYNTLNSDYGAVGLISREAFPAFNLDSPWPSGDHFMYFDFYPSLGKYELTQRGDIPDNAIQFNIYTIAEKYLNYYKYPNYSGIASIRFNGTKIDPITRDISLFAGDKDVEILIEVMPSNISIEGLPSSSFIDGFSFTVPEPSTWITFGIGMLGLVWQLRRRRSV
jgi:hypothetical protein